jgi:hypothetical protein
MLLLLPTYDFYYNIMFTTSSTWQIHWALLLLSLHGYLDQPHLEGPHGLNPQFMVSQLVISCTLLPALLWLVLQHHVLNSTQVILLIPATASWPWTTSPCPCDLSPPQHVYTSSICLVIYLNLMVFTPLFMVNQLVITCHLKTILKQIPLQMAILGQVLYKAPLYLQVIHVGSCLSSIGIYFLFK